jgi:maleate cis-trans isomerase
MNGDYARTRGRARIGVVVPVSNSNLEPDMMMMCPPGVSVHFARAGGYDVDAVPDETQMQRYSEASVDEVIDGLKACKPNVVLYGCTSATLARGPAFDEEFRSKIEARASVPAVTAASALIEALRDLGVERLAFSSPYVASLNDYAVSFLEAVGFRCVGRADTKSPLGNDEVAALTPEDVMALAEEADRPEAEAIVLSCTDMRAAEAVLEIERRLAKPVVTSNQAMMHAALKRLGIAHRESVIGQHRLGRADVAVT